ncbi:Membrane magnesium transporter 1 [Frankliniella fusca]|uniref:Membrane magnesium transporter n=1 Tax=Frankliniella fusca TaxID=407009 RepID=A0AAE1LQW9_9NEOP|nr:Membrane magnesium transporter 1 [Frankliniella fusca]
MAATAAHKFIFVLGISSLLHAAYSAAQHRAYLRITEQEFVGLPIDILIQGIVSLFVTMYGIMTLAGEFKEIRSTVDLESKTWETFRNCPSFYTFNHRGRALSPYYDPPLE